MRRRFFSKWNNKLLLLLILVAGALATFGVWQVLINHKDTDTTNVQMTNNITTAPENLIKFQPTEEQKRQLEESFAQLIKRADDNQATYDEYVQLIVMYQDQEPKNALKYAQFALGKIEQNDPEAQSKQSFINGIIAQAQMRINDAQ